MRIKGSELNKITLIAFIALLSFALNPVFAVLKYDPSSLKDNQIIEGTLLVDSVNVNNLNLQGSEVAIIRASLVGDGSSLGGIAQAGGNGWENSGASITVKDLTDNVTMGSNTEDGKLHIAGGDLKIGAASPRNLYIPSNASASIENFIGLDEFTNIAELDAPLSNEVVVNSKKDMNFIYKFIGALNGNEWTSFNNKIMRIDGNNSRLVVQTSGFSNVPSGSNVKFFVDGTANATNFIGGGSQITNLPNPVAPSPTGVMCQMKDMPSTCNVDELCIYAYQISTGLFTTCADLSNDVSRWCCKKVP